MSENTADMASPLVFLRPITMWEIVKRVIDAFLTNIRRLSRWPVEQASGNK
jgi:hypothetical protein